jgi:hypothetical protein
LKSKHDEILQNLSKWHKEKAKGQQAKKLFLGSLRASRAIKKVVILSVAQLLTTIIFFST